MTRPVRGPLNPTATDHVTDAYDTIDWLVKNTPESNGRVGMIGSSYEGFTVVMALLDPHPALKVAAPESPMVDGWMGDDWFHYGAFRQTNFDYTSQQTTKRDEGEPVPRDAYDDYEAFRQAGSAGAYARLHGLDQLPWDVEDDRTSRLRCVLAGPGAGQAGGRASLRKCPTMWIQGLWDQEDMWGAIHCYLALKARGQADHNYLVMGPWRHSQVNYDGYNLGPLKWDGDTALQFRRDVLKTVLRSVPENRCAQSRHAAGLHLQHRRESLGSPEELAAGLRTRLRRAAEAAVSGGGLRLGIRQARRLRSRRGFLRLRSRQAGSVSSAPGSLRRFGPLEAVAGHRSAHAWPTAPMC